MASLCRVRPCSAPGGDRIFVGVLNSPILRRALRVVAPEGVLLPILIWLAGNPRVEALLVGPASYVLIAVYASAGLLALRFRRSRVILALLVLALAYPVFTDVIAGTGTPAAAVPGARGAGPLPAGIAPRAWLAALLLPLDLAVLAFLGDRGFRSLAGLFPLAAIVAQVALVALLDDATLASVAAALERPWLPAAAAAWTAIPHTVLLAHAAALVVLAVSVFVRPDPIRRGFLWTTTAALLATHAAAAGVAPLVYLLGAGVLLAVAVVEASYALAFRDGLTGLPSRRAFNDELLRLGSRYAIAMVDVDRFKGINDKYGHDVGDQVLRMVATRLSRITGGGKAFRYGGEEFAVVFRGKRLEDVIPHLERVRRAIEDADFTIRGPDRPRRKPKKRPPVRGERTVLRITVSIGAAERTSDADDPEEVVKAADKALYRAKEGGRNRVVA